MSGKPDVRMERSEIDRLLAEADTAFVAWRDADGALRARPFRYRSSPDGLKLDGGEPLPDGAAACAIVDSYPAYDAIRGALLGGHIRAEGGQSELAITRASGFDFAKAGNRGPTRGGQA